MPNKLGFYLHSSHNNNGLWDLFQRPTPPVLLNPMAPKDDHLSAHAARLDPAEEPFDDRLDDAEVVARGDVAPLLLLDPEQREDHEGDHDDPWQHAVAQLGEAVGHPHRLVEAQPVGQPPGPGDEPRVQRELDQGVPVEWERRAETSAHFPAV